MNPRIPYKPGRREREAEGRGDGGGGPGSCLVRTIWLLLPVVALVVVWVVRTQSAASALPTVGANGTALIATVTGLPSGAAPTETLAAPPTDPPLPTGTPRPAPSASPTALRTPAPTQFYISQSGDTIAALAARFGVNPADIVAPQGMRGVTTLASGQLLVIPHVLGEVGPGNKLIPDSELVFSGAAAGFDPQKFALEQGGYLAEYHGYALNQVALGGGVVLSEAQNHSVNPRLLIALLEYTSGWVTNPHPTGNALKYPYGYVHAYLINLNAQLTWATSQLAIGYYGWRDGSLTELKFPDGSTLRLDPTLNAGTVALQYFLSQNLNRPEWDEAVGPTGFITTYQSFFGDPFARALDPLVPPDLTQLPLQLPFVKGSTWYLTGGPHGAWELGGAQAALDFAPGSTRAGCSDNSNAWVTAVAAGLVLRAAQGVVVIDLDGDGRETTGWNILYLHLAGRGRVVEGSFVERGQNLGHPSCEGGRATGTHVHVARKYNGEWIPAAGPVPFDLSGWVAGPGAREYEGTMTKDGVTVEACTCGSASTGIRLDP